MTEKLFYEDSHMEQFQAVVLSCSEGKKGYEVVLDKTAFFPEGGGQSADKGTLDGLAVLDVKEKGGVVCHILEYPIEVGKTVDGRIDYKDRFSKMQQHSGEHIISGLINSTYGYHNVGFHLGDELVTMDFDGVLTKEQLRDIEYRANEAVASNLDILVTYPSKEELEILEYRSKIEIEGQVRIVTIPGYDVCACCAPHVKKTGEIGLIKLTGFQNYKGGIRVSMLCGFRALADYNTKEDNTKAISRELSAKEEVLVEAVIRQKEEAASLKGQLISVQRQLLNFQASEIPKGKERVWIFENKLDGTMAREFVNLILEKEVRICGVFFGNDKEGYRYVLGSKQEDVRPVSKKLNEAFEGKGGGKQGMVQGSMKGTKEEINRFLEGEE